jgi:prolyl-tRNA editing enzyme YbaK/EbsC (Cys-tRNA(Pro) deacylase)
MREKVISAARERGMKLDVRRLEGSAATVEQAARAVGCEAAQIARSTVFVADGDPVICVAPGERGIDSEKLCDALDCAEARPAAPGEVRAATGFAVGGVSPIAHELPMVIDEALLEYELVYAAAGDGHSLFAVEPVALARSAGALVAAVAADRA